ncbi:MAG TPA: hypothetical protein VGS23_07435 [Thermoplasmata archaeon]|nr:hypothetical protein [Thermoplasmata archaeon]
MIPGVDPGLRERFRAAGAQISWRDVEAPKAKRAPSKGRRPAARSPKAPETRVRIAHLNDEDARVEATEDGDSARWVVDSGPVGALVLLLELERRGPPELLTTRDAEDASPFPQGAIEARWQEGARARVFDLPIPDLIQLARYALA